MHIIRSGTLTTQRYADEILRSHVVPSAAAIVNLFLLIQNNARPRSARHVTNILKIETAQRMEWPAFFLTSVRQRMLETYSNDALLHQSILLLSKIWRSLFFKRGTGTGISQSRGASLSAFGTFPRDRHFPTIPHYNI